MDFLKDILGLNIEFWELGIITLVIIFTGVAKIFIKLEDKYRLLYALFPFAISLFFAIFIAVINTGSIMEKLKMILTTFARYGAISLFVYDVIFDKIRKVFEDKLEVKDVTKNN